MPLVEASNRDWVVTAYYILHVILANIVVATKGRSLGDGAGVRMMRLVALRGRRLTTGRASYRMLKLIRMMRRVLAGKR